ncbi:hypothetical protein D3C73_887350 [compost metagenome]
MAAVETGAQQVMMAAGSVRAIRACTSSALVAVAGPVINSIPALLKIACSTSRSGQGWSVSTTRSRRVSLFVVISDALAGLISNIANDSIRL